MLSYDLMCCNPDIEPLLQVNGLSGAVVRKLSGRHSIPKKNTLLQGFRHTLKAR